MANGLPRGVANAWPPFTGRIAPNALPYGVTARCWDVCERPSPCTLHYFPSPCMCTTVGPPATWSAPLTQAQPAQAR